MQIKHKFSGAGGAHIQGFGRRGPLLNAVGGGAGGSGGAGGAGGQPGPGGAGGQPGEGGAPEGTLSELAKREVGDMVNAAVNGAVTNHLTRFKKQFTEEVTGLLGQSLGPISEQLKLLAERPAPAAGGGKGGQPDQVSDQVKADLLRYEARIKELEGIAKNERDAREQEKATRLREEERTTLANVLRQAGLGDPQVKAAVAVLHTEDKKVSRTEDGRIVFKIERGSGAAKYTDEMDLDKGVGEWLKTDEGKGYVPARQAAGAGGQAARPGAAPRNQTEAKQQATASLAAMLLGGGTGQ